MFSLLLYKDEITSYNKHLKAKENYPEPYINPKQEKSGKWIWFVLLLGFWLTTKGELP